WPAAPPDCASRRPARSPALRPPPGCRRPAAGRPAAPAGCRDTARPLLSAAAAAPPPGDADGSPAPAARSASAAGRTAPPSWLGPQLDQAAHQLAEGDAGGTHHGGIAAVGREARDRVHLVEHDLPPGGEEQVHPGKAPAAQRPVEDLRRLLELRRLLRG